MSRFGPGFEGPYIPPPEAGSQDTSEDTPKDTPEDNPEDNGLAEASETENGVEFPAPLSAVEAGADMDEPEVEEAAKEGAEDVESAEIMEAMEKLNTAREAYALLRVKEHKNEDVSPEEKPPEEITKAEEKYYEELAEWATLKRAVELKRLEQALSGLDKSDTTNPEELVKLAAEITKLQQEVVQGSFSEILVEEPKRLEEAFQAVRVGDLPSKKRDIYESMLAEREDSEKAEKSERRMRRIKRIMYPLIPIIAGAAATPAGIAGLLFGGFIGLLVYRNQRKGYERMVERRYDEMREFNNKLMTLRDEYKTEDITPSMLQTIHGTAGEMGDLTKGLGNWEQGEVQEFVKAALEGIGKDDLLEQMLEERNREIEEENQAMRERYR